MANTKITTNVIADGAITSAKLDTNITISGNITGTLATAAQPNITSVGTLTGLTTTGDINFGDNDKAVFGAGSDLQIYSDGTHSRIYESGSGLLIVRASNFNVNNADGSDSYITMQDGGAVTAYYDGSAKLATTATGIDVTGTATMDGLTSVGGFISIGADGAGDDFRFYGDTSGRYMEWVSSADSLLFRDGAKALFGNGSDLQIYHNSSNNSSYIDEGGAGDLYVRATNIWFQNTGPTATFAKFTSGGAIELRHNDGIKLATTSTGIDVTGTATMDGLTVDGAATITANLDVGADNGLGGKLSIQTSSYGVLQDMRTLVAGGINPYLTISSSADGITFEENGSQYKSLMFKTGATERLRIDSSGNVGIGTADADSKLKVELNPSGTVLAGLRVGYNGTSVNYLDGDTNIFRNGVGNTERMRIDSSGNVGIGQTSPYSHASFTSLSMGGTSGKSGLVEFKYSNDASKGVLYAQSAAVTLESIGTNLIRFGTNAAFRGAIDSKGTLFFGNGDSSYGHNTYAHAAVFTKNSTPQGTVVIEDSDVSSGVGNTVLRCFLRDQDPAGTAIFIDFADGGGRVGSVSHNDDGGGVSYNTTSDYRLKENVNYDWDALTLLGQLRPAKFNFISNPAKTVQGFLAHEVSDIVPSSVRGNKDHIESIGTVTDSDGNVIYEGVYEHFCKTDEGQTWTRTGEEPMYQQLDYSRIVPLLTKAIQEQQTIIDDLKSRIEALEG